MRLLVDDRDGRIVAELQTQEDVERVLKAWTQGNAPLPTYLCIGRMVSNRAGKVAAETMI
jgi:hypothetical protein